MKLLLDTHVFLWYITADSQLPSGFRASIEDPANEVFLSAASVWEAVIKQGINRLPLPGPAAEYRPDQRSRHGIAPLPINESEFGELAGLPMLHRDPFGRLIVAQALTYQFTLVTVDAAVLAYGAPHLTAG